MVISVFNMLQLIHLYKLEAASGPNVAHVAAPAQNELEIDYKKLRKNIRRAEEEVTQVKSSSVLGELHKENHGSYLSLCNQCDRDEGRTNYIHSFRYQ
jgi:hypothetical protein